MNARPGDLTTWSGVIRKNMNPTLYVSKSWNTLNDCHMQDQNKIMSGFKADERQGVRGTMAMAGEERSKI